MIRRRSLAAALPALLAAPALAQSDRPIRLVVPAPPGGPTDILARVTGERAAAALGQPVVVDNRAGAGGVIGAEAAMRGAPDGLTLILGHNQTHASNQAMMPRLPYHVVNSFTPVAKLATVHHATVVPAGSRARTMAELVALGRDGGRLSYASSGAGSASHVISETFVRRSGMSATHVPYRGAAPAATDTVAGVVDFYTSTFPTVAGLIRDGRLRALQVGAPARLAGFPDLPTSAEAGVPFMAVDAWFGLFAPAGLPAPMAQRIADAFLGALRDAEAQRRLAAAAFTLDPLGPEAFAAFQRAEVARWAEMVDLTGVKLEG
ncbi:Bug family tripartite tricarboxylate transporter substrate binding protein [Falsiroseomonas selenitidurans]|uniref:Tripartite tricarboxylate transporter substrate binding protein n=1 Tax=Falsiroseomonas selenitidurans TaxID=2716335 RepID=A0ABX1E4Z9_9PROT|nr:tripartite tricarboxylate transporter substrate binding protein [Falsiroseomonas selenitidurans]NKC31800.1 tripartite tricarboxylate transporter substrate binding protein [Falsiroseomonas selenitidurans]OYW09956.1 MAG: ABC transporter substrate-binding protein [Rhodospirillales bacterium 12-71-4]